MRVIRLPKHVEKGKIYTVYHFDPKRLKWIKMQLKVEDIYENKTLDGSPGAQIIVCRRVKKL